MFNRVDDELALRLNAIANVESFDIEKDVSFWQAVLFDVGECLKQTELHGGYFTIEYHEYH